MVKVSVIVPIYNVQAYLRQCLDSIASQTLTDIEAICVNDGSTDSSLDIVMEYVSRDRRFKVIDKKNSGYGNSMNMGFDMAHGEYISIIESDDYAEPHMLERLYSCAKEHKLDICKGGFYFYFSAPTERNTPYVIPEHLLRKGVFCPSTDFATVKKKIEFFGIKPTIWSAIYRTEYVRKNNLRFTETPGASYQDASFNFKAWACAERVMLINESLLHYRQDNEGSSVNSSAKVFAVCDEYAEIERFLSQTGRAHTDLSVVKNVLKFNTYMWNYERLSEERAGEFILAASRELAKDMASEKCPRRAYSWRKWKRLNSVIRDPQGFHQRRQSEKKSEIPVLEADEQGGVLKRWIRRLRKNGVRYTVKSLLRKLK